MGVASRLQVIFGKARASPIEDWAGTPGRDPLPETDRVGRTVGWRGYRSPAVPDETVSRVGSPE
jgi:hypothetical protein